MIAINVISKNEFMNAIFIKDTFDYMLVSELELTTINTFSVDGRINKDFIKKNELEEPEDDFISRGSIRHICFEIIKGKNAPLKFKITLKLPNSYIEKMLTSVDTNIEASQVLGMYIHINYENNKLNVTTGTSLSIFTMDKSIDKFWDKQITTLLNQHFELEIE